MNAIAKKLKDRKLPTSIRWATSCGAWKMKIDAPEYDAEEFRRKEKIAIIVGLVYSALAMTVDVMEAMG